MWTINTIVITTGTLVGLVIIATVFYVQESRSYHSSNTWIRKYKFAFRGYEWVRPSEILVIATVLCFSLGLGLVLVYRGTQAFGDVPPVGEPMSESEDLRLSRLIDSLTRDFRRFLITVGVDAAALVAMGYFLSWSSEYLQRAKEALERLKKDLPATVLAKLDAYVKGVAEQRGASVDNLITSQILSEDYAKGDESVVKRLVLNEVKNLWKGYFAKTKDLESSTLGAFAQEMVSELYRLRGTKE